MNEESKKIIRGRFEKLPKQLQGAILAADLPEKFRTIMTKHKLRLDQAADVENETMLVMLGLEHPDAYTENIMREAKLDETKAREIAEDINRMIFLPIRTTLRELHGREVAEEAPTPTPPQSPPHPRGGGDAPLPSGEGGTGAGLQQPTTDIFREKMGGVMHMPKEDLSLGIGKKPTVVPPPPRPPSTDLYREPIEEKDVVSFKRGTVPPARPVEKPAEEHGGEKPSASQTPPKIPSASAERGERQPPVPRLVQKHDSYREPVAESERQEKQKEVAPPANLPTAPRSKDGEKDGENEPKPIVIGRLPQ